ncbi:MAG: restriction endonuclease subunit S, partial [Chloroflexota bacterium]|nr:restriction endonuclease subunit S [Chloroflexota bacterium]
MAALGEACLVIQGQSPPGKTYNANEVGLPFLQGKAEFGTTYPIATKWCSAPSKIAEPDDVLVSIRAPVGPTNLCAIQSCIGRGLAAIRTQGDIPSKYVLYAMRATEEELRANATGTTFEAIRGNDLRSHTVPLAPLAEQHRIVAEIEKQFTRLDASVAAMKRVHANLRRYRASVLKAACEGRLVPIEAELALAEGRDYEHASVLLERILAERRVRWEFQSKRRGKYKEPVGPDASNLPELPEGWTWATAAQLGEVRLGRQRSPKKATGPHMRPYLRAANVTWDGLDLSDVKSM